MIHNFKMQMNAIFFFLLVISVNARTNPRFDMRDKDGIIFDPIAPRAGERLIARCTLVGLTDTDKRSVRIEENQIHLITSFFRDISGQLGVTSFE